MNGELEIISCFLLVYIVTYFLLVYIYATLFCPISQGQEWRKVRSVLDKQMMKPSHVVTYTKKVYEVNADFLRRLRRIRREDMSVPDMDKELFNWSLES